MNAVTNKPIPGAFVTLGNKVMRADPDGRFMITGNGVMLGLRAYGYGRRDISVAKVQNNATLTLAPLTPKALYLSSYGIDNIQLRDSALDLINKTALNALVIEVKNSRGMIAFQAPTALTAVSGTQKVITIKHIRHLINDLHKRGIYLIARIVVFRDNALASKKPNLAVKTQAGAIWKDRQGMAWTDPFQRKVWDYNIDVAVEAAKDGFDEIQFDYVRFPSAKDVVFSKKNTEPNRVMAIEGFLADARRQLIPYNVFTSADIFGYAIWNLNDTGIGQNLKELAQEVDYISPMLYPSTFQYGIYGYPNPTRHPYQIIYLSLRKAEERTGLPPIRFRPWLQAFRDYTFSRPFFGDEEMAAQIDASQTFKSDGWMLWNPRNIYTLVELPLKSRIARNKTGPDQYVKHKR